MNQIAPGWYPDNYGQMRWWDGRAWQQPAPQPDQQPQPMPQQVAYAGRTANNMPVSYTRQQQGHSLTKHLLLGWMLFYIPTIYYAVSPNHYWHL